MPHNKPAKTLFSRIIDGELPCFKIYEDDLTFSFLDIHPLSPGHTLLVSKEPAATLDKLSEVSAAALGRILPKICRALLRATSCSDYNVLQNNGVTALQSVPHVHFHIIPKPNEAQGLQMHWQAQALKHQEAEALSKKIKAELLSIQ